MENVTSQSVEHTIYGENSNRVTINNGGNQTSDPTTWVHRTPPKHDLSPLIGHVTVGGSPRLQVIAFMLN